MSGIILSIVIIVVLFFVIYAFVVKDSKLSGVRNINKEYTIKSDTLKDIIDNHYYMSLWYNIDNKIVKTSGYPIPTMETPQTNKGHKGQYRLFKWPAIPKKMYNEHSVSSSSDNCEMCDDPIVKLSAYFDQNLKNINIYLGDELQETFGQVMGTALNEAFLEYNNTIQINDVPLYGWNNLIISVNQSVVDVYINGELRISRPIYPDNKGVGKILKNIVSTPCLCIGDNGLVGNIGNIKFGRKSLSTEDATSLYMEGLGENPIKQFLDKYRIKIAVQNNQTEMSSLEL